MFLSHPPLAYLVGRDHCAEILDLMTPTQLLIAFLRASGHSDAGIARTLGLSPTTITRAMDALAERIAEELPELRVALEGRCCPPATAANRPAQAPETLSASQAAERLQMSPRTVRLWCRQGRFANASRLGPGRSAHWQIPGSDLDPIRQAGQPPQSDKDGGALPAAPVARCRNGRFPNAFRDLARPQDPNCETLTVDQVADRLRVSTRTVRAWCRQGRLPAANRDGTRPGAPWRIPASDLPKFDTIGSQNSCLASGRRRL